MQALHTVSNLSSAHSLAAAIEREQERPSVTISLEFAPDVDPIVRARISYAFRVFAAIYGYAVPQITQRGDFHCVYGDAHQAMCGGDALYIPARYRAGTAAEGQPILQRVRFANEDFHLVYGLDPETGQPDWLGEIFAWLSSSLELSIGRRDSVGRLPWPETVFCRQDISPQKPHAAMMMALLQNALHGKNGNQPLPRPQSPSGKVEHFVVCSHDLDFCFTSTAAAWQRLAKNLAIAVTHYASPSFFATNVKMMLQLVRGGRPGDYLPSLLAAIEKSGFSSTIFAVADGVDRRDPNYRLSGMASHLVDCMRRGFPVALHGSYRSIVENASLRNEVAAMQNVLGTIPRGNRQHWLRFDNHQKLLDVVARARFAYDSSLGFAEVCGFRNGACFPFPPYDFAKEQPCSFLEIPLVLMDSALHSDKRRLRQTPQSIADAVLGQSRRWGWGGVSVLWHNPMESIQVPAEINDVFWNSAAKRSSFHEEWTSAETFLDASLKRFHAAGLLQQVRADA